MGNDIETYSTLLFVHHTWIFLISMLSFHPLLVFGIYSVMIWPQLLGYKVKTTHQVESTSKKRPNFRTGSLLFLLLVCTLINGVHSDVSSGVFA